MVKEVAGVRVALIDPIAATNVLADEITATNQADVVVALFYEGVEDPNAFHANVDVVFAGFAGDTH